MADLTTVDGITSPVRNKIQNVSLISLQSLTTAPRDVSASIDISNVSSVSVVIHLGRISTGTFTAGINFRIEMSSAVSGDGYWFPVTTFTSALGASISSTTVSTQSNSGQNVLTVASTSPGGFAFVVGNIIYIQNATESNSEFARIKAISGVAPGTLTLEDNLRFTQQVGAIVTNQAEMYYGLIDTTSFTRLRIFVDGTQGGSATNFDTEAFITVGA